MKYAYLAWISSIISLYSSIFLFYDIWKSQNVASFSYKYLIGSFISIAMYLAYALINNSPEMWVPTLIGLSMIIYYLYIKIKNDGLISNILPQYKKIEL